MNDILRKLIKGQPVTDDDLVEALWEKCEIVHPDCDGRCPVYAVDRTIPWDNSLKKDRECCCCRSGSRMLAYLRAAENEGRLGQ